MRRRTFLQALAAATVAACTSGDGPIEPAWGKEPCAHCAMVLSERRFGAQLLTRAGDRFFFDDPGCMVAFAEERGAHDPRVWVYDESAARWTDATTARFASGAATPMDYGFQANAAGTIPWSELRARVLAKRRATQ